jgi:hypothetical protein
MFARLAKLAVTKDPAAACQLISDALVDKTGSVVAEGIVAAAQQNSGAVIARFCQMTWLDPEFVGGCAFIWIPAGEREVGLILTEGQYRGQWSIQTVDQLMAAFSPRDGYSVASRRSKLKVVK